MPYRKIKQESYNSLGGIDNKISQFLNSPVEFLQLENLDFQIPGSLSLRWGSTYYVGQTLVGKVTGLQEFVKITGQSYVVVTGQTQAMTVTGTSLTSFFSQVSHASFLTYTSHIRATQYGFTSPWLYSLGASLNYDFQVMDNWLFACNGVDFWKFNGTSAYFFSMGQPIKSAGASDLFGAAPVVATGITYSGLTSGLYDFKIAYINNRGVVGQATHRAYVSSFANPGASNAIIFTFADSIFQNIEPGYGISGFQIFVAGPDQDIAAPNNIPEQNKTYYLCLDVTTKLPFTLCSASGATTACGLTYMFYTEDQIGVTSLQNLMPFGRWYIDNNNYAPDDFAFSPQFGAPPRIPKFVELWGNPPRMVMGGMTFAPSSVMISEDSEPEQIQLDSVFDVRTDDGQPVTGLKNFSGGTVIFKENSFHMMTGDDFTNISIRQVSQEYGCLNNRAIAQFKDVLVFLDRKGIIEFNGSNIQIISTKIDPILKRMNIDAARVEACMTYDKLRNEILCDIPIDGSSVNNITLVFDIIQNAWTTYKYGNYTPAVSAIVKGRLDNFYVFAGGYSGTIVTFGPSYLTDPGTGITASGISYLIGSRFHTEEGNSMTKQYRRLFINTSTAGSTVALDIEFYKDFSTSSTLSRTMYQGAFQQRIDFGIPGKSLAFTLAGVSTTEKMIFHGYTLEHRFQRSV